MLVQLELVVEEIGSGLSFADAVGARGLTCSSAVLAFAQAASSPRHVVVDAIAVGALIGFASVGDLVVLRVHLVDLGLLRVHVEDLLLVLFLLAGQIVDHLVVRSLDLIELRDNAGNLWRALVDLLVFDGLKIFHDVVERAADPTDLWPDFRRELRDLVLAGVGLGLLGRALARTRDLDR